MDSRIAIVLQAGAESHEGMARALHSLLYAKELHEQGARVQLIFDGAGTEWLARFHGAGESPVGGMARMFEHLKEDGVAYQVCDFCSGAFGVREDLRAHGESLTAAYMDHPSIASLVAEGYQIWIL